MANGDSEVSRLVDQLEREHCGEPWHGEPLGADPSGITHQQAAVRPLRGGHSDLGDRAAPHRLEERSAHSGSAVLRPGVRTEGDWPVPPSSPMPDDWRDALAALDVPSRPRRRRRPDLPDSQLFDPTNDPRVDAESADTYFQLVEGILQHDIYHSGRSRC